jgi:hypothetical protein
MRRARIPVEIAALAALVLTLSSCAEVRWHKKDGDDSALSQDLMACRRLAMERTVRMGGNLPRTEIGPVFGPMGPSPADARLQESQAVTVCMREKGYGLVPASAPGT